MMMMTTTTCTEKTVGDLGDKRRWRQYTARVKELPTNYRTTVEALERYLTSFGAITKGDVPMDVLMWINNEREQSVSAIERAGAQDGGTRS